MKTKKNDKSDVTVLQSRVMTEKIESSLSVWLDNYEAGLEVKSVLMGGLGDGYEICIQNLAVEIMRKLRDINVPDNKEEFSNIVEKYADESCKELNDKFGFSGAQYAVAKNLAAVFWNLSPEEGMKTLEEDRIIKIRKSENGELVLCK